jgi:hypothetical protein
MVNRAARPSWPVLMPSPHFPEMRGIRAIGDLAPPCCTGTPPTPKRSPESPGLDHHRENPRDIRYRSTPTAAATSAAAEMIATISAATARQESSWPSSLARLFVSVVLVDFLPQRVERVVSAGLDGAQWHAEGFGGLGRRCAAEVTLEEHLTVLGRQRP